MIQEDTVKLLRECNAGIKMGVSSLDEVLPKVQSASCLLYTSWGPSSPAG